MNALDRLGCLVLLVAGVATAAAGAVASSTVLSVTGLAAAVVGAYAAERGRDW